MNIMRKKLFKLLAFYLPHSIHYLASNLFVAQMRKRDFSKVN